MAAATPTTSSSNSSSGTEKSGSEKTESQKRATLLNIINDAAAAFMVTRGADGQSFHGRPMATAQVEEGFVSIWFATNRESGKVDEIKADDRVYLGYTNGSGSEWASINGRARVVDDDAKRRELWTPLWKKWWEGPDDPRIVLIEVFPESAEYWDQGSRLVMYAKMAVSAVTSARPSDGEHATVEVGRNKS